MSGHEIHADVITASSAEVVRMIALVSLAFDEGTVRLTSMPADFTVDADDDGIAETYAGVGELGKISDLAEGTELQPYTGQLTLSGIDPAMIALAVGSHYQGRRAQVWAVFLDDQHAM